MKKIEEEELKEEIIKELIRIKELEERRKREKLMILFYLHKDSFILLFHFKFSFHLELPFHQKRRISMFESNHSQFLLSIPIIR
jgi:hypothetical protein